jgi:hypothetical protein
MRKPPADAPVSLDEAIAFVRRLHPDADPLLQLEDAVVVGERLEEISDDLVGHFVHQARDEGATWSTIGESMGVTKQAAQKRFVVSADNRSGGLLSRFTIRARRALDVARDEAQRMGSAEVLTTHVLLGLVSDPDGLSMKVLAEMGVTAESVSAAVEQAKPAPVAKPPARVPFAPESRTVLQVAVEEAVNLGHNYIGTEHLLLAVVAGRTTGGAKILADLGVTRRKCLTRLKRAIAQIVAERTGA